MKRRFFIFGGLSTATAACVDLQENIAFDATAPRDPHPWNYPRPAACRRDLSAIDLPVVSVPWNSPLLFNTKGQRGHAVTHFIGFVDPKPSFIAIRDDATGSTRAFLLHHERCHVVAGPDWHKQ